jgi:hypothetical protein
MGQPGAATYLDYRKQSSIQNELGSRVLLVEVADNRSVVGTNEIRFACGCFAVFSPHGETRLRVSRRRLMRMRVLPVAIAFVQVSRLKKTDRPRDCDTDDQDHRQSYAIVRVELHLG